MGSLLALSTSHSLLPSLFVYGLRRCTASLELGDNRPHDKQNSSSESATSTVKFLRGLQKTTLRWWTTSKTTCSTAQISVRHLAEKILQGVVAAEAKLRRQDQPSQSSAVPRNAATQPHVKCYQGLSSRRIRSQWVRQLPAATVVHAPCAQATYRRRPRPTSGCPDSIRRERLRRSPASPHSVPRC